MYLTKIKSVVHIVYLETLKIRICMNLLFNEKMTKYG